MYRAYVKRLLDLVVALSVLTAFFWLYAGIAFVLLIVNSGRPFYTQTRAGKNGKLFKLIKFKTMNDRKDNDGQLLPDTMRLTSFGRILRKASLDEIPQILNVLKGDMSIVGPRPLLPEYLPYYSEHHARRHEVRPGVTGLAQVSGRNNLKFSERFDLDVKYIESISLWGDIKILLRTVLRILTPSDIQLGRPLSDVDDVGVTRGLANHYRNEKT
jgi:undecaprenyl phosphate N,N'-diacetylbacillosamine 1-phosphate transferase